MLIRHATRADAAGCLEIYGPLADSTPTSFEAAAPTPQVFADRIERAGDTHAFLVADDRGSIAGFAYAGVHRAREAYRWSAEVSVYLHEAHRGRGLGRKLYETLFPLLGAQGYRMLLAGITLPNDASAALHRALGFMEIGVYQRIGWKAGAWRDVMWLALPLGAETRDAVMPPPPGAPVRLRSPVKI